ncbi:hypothetical protein [Flavobacterium sp. N1994]|uniref:hypothetical protein n=1 Tax=Flavobacterium sp. N1994 TaxID=2986827 RepID=UPI002222F3E5|nr:hypothetical protein [Flavobacterium sp. N1994]
MKNIKIIAILLFALSMQFATAQKVKIKDNIAYVDDTPYLKVSDCGMYKEDCSISNLEGKVIITIDKLPNQAKPGTYLQIAFKGLNTSIELNTTMSRIVKLLYKNNAIDKEGNLIPENVKLIATKYTREYSLKEGDD